MSDFSSLLELWVTWFCDVTTVLLCVVCKIPQILLIYRAKSVDGISEKSVAVELLTYMISLSYNAMKGYPISSYLEDPFLSLQTLAVLLIVYSYHGKLDKRRIGEILGVSVLFYVLSFGIPHPIVLQGLLTATLPMKIYSKVLQLMTMWRARSAGSVSMVSWGINIYTCLTRIVTTLLVTQDTTILVKHTISVTLNSAVVASAWWFSKEQARKYTEIKKGD